MQDSKFDRGRMIKDIEDFTLSYNSLVKAYSADKRSSDCDQWRDFSKALGIYRNAGIDASGIRPTEILVYRLLRRLSVNVVEQASALGRECQTIRWSLE